jgi:hypothetical protein
MTHGLLVRHCRFPDPRALREEFRERGYVTVSAFLNATGLTQLRSLSSSLDDRAFRRDLDMPQSHFTPRRMSVIGGAATNDEPDLMAFYSDETLLSWCSDVTGHGVTECPNEVENVIFTRLHKVGDTHGWHHDDYPLALIVVLRMPSGSDAGAHLEIETRGRVERVALHAGDAYLMRTDVHRHRVAPLQSNEVREILNCTYSFVGATVAENGSADLLCSERPDC